MKALTPQVFDFKGNQLRIIKKNDDIFFVAKDICDVLLIGNSSQAITRLDENERASFKMTTSGGDQNLTLVTESGFYSLVLSSRKEEAKEFKKWVTSEVLPTIRKTGSYSLSAELDQRYQIVSLLEQFILDVGSANKASVALKIVSSANISLMVNNKWDKISDAMWRNVESSIKNWYRLRKISPEIYKDVFSPIVEKNHLPTLKSKVINFISKSRDKEINAILVEYLSSLDEMERKM